MKRRNGSALPAPRGRRLDRPVIAVNEVKLDGVNDYYTPEVFKLAPTEVTVTVGQKGKGRVRCEIQEGEWERRHVGLAIIFERYPGEVKLCFDSDIDNDFGLSTSGSFTLEQIDRLILALTEARREADRRGLFTSRPTPRTVEEVLAAGGAREA